MPESAPDHYLTLEVDPRATKDELRAAYLRLARANHPDGFEGPARSAAESRMQEINEAWNAVGVPHKRKEYDRTRADVDGFGASAGPRRGNAHFTPFDDDDDLIDRSDVDLDPTPIHGSKQIPRWISLMPIILVLWGVVFFGVGLLVNAAAVIAVAMIIVALGGVGFLMMPLIVMSRAERDPNL
ncbi:MAG: DnaJ domain-containing protein [Actinomycetota bacterium]